MTDTLTLEGPQDIAFDEIPEARNLVPTDRRLLPAPIERLTEVANLLASSGPMVPKAFRGQPELCMAVAYQAALWGTDPVATINKAYLVNDRIAYEAQLISAIVRKHLESDPIYTYQGAGAQRCVQVTATPIGGKPLNYQSPIKGQIKPQNSPLWAVDPDQQLSYYGIRAWARRHRPGVLLGIYAMDELQQVSIRDVTPRRIGNIFDETNIDDLPEAEIVDDADYTFEPSGGAGVVNTDVTNTTHDRTAGANEQEEPADDPQEWFETMKGRVDDAKDRSALGTLWRTTRANHNRLNAEDKAAALDLTERFKERGKALPSD